MHDLNATERDPCRVEAFESQHGSDHAFDSSMILLDRVVQILDLPDFDLCFELVVDLSLIATEPNKARRIPLL